MVAIDRGFVSNVISKCRTTRSPFKRVGLRLGARNSVLLFAPLEQDRSGVLRTIPHLGTWHVVGPASFCGMITVV